MADGNFPKQVERWGLFEFSSPGKTDGNPFTDYTITGVFKSKNEEVNSDGFYDDEGIYRIRFMPSFEEEYKFEIKGSFSEISFNGNFKALPPSANNHGPVHVAKEYHFAYEDGKPYYPIGTTCYVWNFQNETLQKKTLETLKKETFNKIRFCILPKHYDYNLKDPITYPYKGKPMDSSVLTRDNYAEYFGAASGNQWDFKQFNPEHFRQIEKCIVSLQKLNIEADLIVMHNYDRWGFSVMDAECDDLYWNYVVARFSAYRNVWWSLANEYDLMTAKTTADWERYANILCKKDPYRHLRGIHNCRPFYDHTRPWITHVCIQRQDLYKCAELVAEYREQFRKPIVLDEISYEGNVPFGWGNISGKEMVRRFWEAACRGGYAGHGETYLHPEGIIWWSHGGELYGESPKRLAFLRRILSETPGLGLMPYKAKAEWDDIAATAEDTIKDSGYYLFYYSFMRPSFRDFHFDDVNEYRAEVIDTWEMTIEDKGCFKGKFKVELPAKEYMAIRIRRVN